MKNLSELTQYLVDLFNADTTIGLSKVFYGDQLLIPSDKVLCIEPSVKRTEVTGANRLTNVTFEVTCILYYMKVQNAESNRQGCDLMADAIANLLNSLNSINGNVMHSYVREVSPDYTKKTNENIFAVSKITFVAETRERLGS